MAVVLEVGPGDTFLFDTPGGTTTNKLPDALKDIEHGVGVGKPIHQIYCINFGWNGAFFLGARNAHGNIIRRHNLPPQLEAWLIDPNLHVCRRDIPSLRIELGPHGSFYAFDNNSYRWHGLPDALEEAIQQRITPAGWTATPEWVVLGADGAYIYANNCGGHSYALGNYPKLMGLIQGLHQTNINGHTGFALIQWISMSIYHPGHFIALHRSGNHVAELHFDANQALNSMASTFPKNSLQPVMVAKRTPSTTSTASPPMMSPTSPQMTAKTTPPVAQTPAFQAPGQAPMAHPQLARRPASQTHTSVPMQHAQAARPMPQHQASTPVPHTQPARPMPQHQASTPVPHTQTVRPVSMQHVSSPSVPQVHTTPKAHTAPQVQNQNRQASNSLTNFLTGATSVVANVVAADIRRAQHHPHHNNYNTNNNNNNNNYDSNTQTQSSGGDTVVVVDSGDTGSLTGDNGDYNGAGVDSGGSSFWSPLQDIATSAISGAVTSGGDTGGDVTGALMDLTFS